MIVFMCIQSILTLVKQESKGYKTYCYESIDKTIKKKLILTYTKKYKEPPEFLRVELSFHKPTDTEGQRSAQNNKKTICFRRFEKVCQETLIIHNERDPQGIYDVFLTFYSGNDRKRLTELRFTFDTNVADGRYRIDGSVNFFRIEVELQRKGKEQSQGANIFPRDIAPSLLNPETGICLSNGVEFYYIAAYMQESRKDRFSGIMGIEFYCSRNDKQYKVYLSAWNCLLDGDKIYSSTFVHIDGCGTNSIWISVKNINNQQFDANLAFLADSAPIPVPRIYVYVKNIERKSWSDFQSIKSTNIEFVVYCNTLQVSKGTCPQFPEDVSVKSSVDFSGNFIAYLWHIEQDYEGGITQYPYRKFQDSRRCSFNQ